MRSLVERNVPPTAAPPGLYAPGQHHRDGPLTERVRTAWNFVIGGVIVGGIVLFVLAAIFHWG